MYYVSAAEMSGVHDVHFISGYPFQNQEKESVWIF